MLRDRDAVDGAHWGRTGQGADSDIIAGVEMFLFSAHFHSDPLSPPRSVAVGKPSQLMSTDLGAGFRCAISSRLSARRLVLCRCVVVDVGVIAATKPSVVLRTNAINEPKSKPLTQAHATAVLPHNQLPPHPFPLLYHYYSRHSGSSFPLLRRRLSTGVLLPHNERVRALLVNSRQRLPAFHLVPRRRDDRSRSRQGSVRAGLHPCRLPR